ncbi:hypothetical protein HMI55_001957 [Coelomomyces lativittatus]|nr:hypothetical protein HMI55_001957 [Coelomomyces lativittatus]
MPLIILSGYPCSGKTRRAQQLQTYFESEPFQTMYPTKLHSIHLINDASLNISRTMYLDPNLEKKARAAMLSAVERLLSPTTLVIVDAMNYIKGVRYQLYCIARAMSTPHCVV